MSTILTGFLLKDVYEVPNLELIIYEMRNIVEKKATIAYNNLIQTQVERIVDEITLNQYKRPEEDSILAIAVNEVNRRVLYAQSHMHETEFNLYIGIQVMAAKIDNNPVLYLKTICPNDIYTKGFKKIKEMIPYDINEDDLDAGKEKAKFFQYISEKYSTDIPIVSTLLRYENIRCNPDTLKFRSPAERAEDIAIEKLMNHLLSCYGCDSQISPNKLMEYMNLVYNRLHNPEIIEEINMEKNHLKEILPTITKDLITKTGTFFVPSEPSEQEDDKKCSDPEKESSDQ